MYRNRIFIVNCYKLLNQQRNVVQHKKSLIYRSYANYKDLVGNHSSSSSKTWPKIEWFYIPAGLGFALIGFIQLKHILRREQKQRNFGDTTVLHNNEDDVKPPGFVFAKWQVDLMRNLPTRALSRAWGFLADCRIPVWLRKPLMNTYGYLFDCNLHEAIISDVTQYETFNEYFTRKLKPGARVIDENATLVSPADSTVLTFGCVQNSNLELEQVKGFTYPLGTFLGLRHPFYRKIQSAFSEPNRFFKPGSCEVDEKNDFKLFYCTLYLGPGDYHWFHSPTEWTVEHRRHIPGDLFSVNPRALRTINGIFNFNERVVLSGHWEHGILMYGAVGAYNVGSIKLSFAMDKDLRTNKPLSSTETFKDRLYSKGILLRRGESIGRFELGSSLVLVFTAPKDFQFVVTPGQKLNYGQPLGVITDRKKCES